MNNTELTAFLKDVSKAVKRVVKRPEILDSLGTGQLYGVRDTFETYHPKTDEGSRFKQLALVYINERLHGKEAEPPVVTVISDEVTQEVAQRIAEESVVLEMHIRQPGFTKKIDSDTFLDKSGNNANVDSDVLHVHQDLIDKRHVKKLMDHRAGLLGYIRSWEVPGGMLTPGGGQFLVPRKAIDKIYAKIEEFGQERQALLDEFGEAWGTIINEAKIKRGEFFDQSDYPDFKTVRTRYSHDFRFISNKVPDELRKESARIYQAELNKRMFECATAANEIQSALRQGFKELVEHFAERLGTDEKTGKPKRFNEKRLTDIRDFLETFQARNLTGDAELAALCEKAEQLLEGVDAAQIRSNEEVRTSLKRAFDDVTASTDQLIEVKVRKVRVAGVGE